MNRCKTVLRQLLQFLPGHEFNVCVRLYRGEHRVESFTTFDRFLCPAYARLSGRESLRDITPTWASSTMRDFEGPFPIHSGRCQRAA
jgi:hypothetical protein